MADQVEIELPKTVVNESSGFTATARFRTRSSGEASVPTTVHYKLFSISSREIIQDWTSVTAAAEVSISITPSNNAIKDSTKEMERVELLVAADKDLSTQHVGRAHYKIRDLEGIDS